MVTPLNQKEVAAVFGRQLPFLGINPYEEVMLNNSYPSHATPDGISPAGRTAFSNANCAVKRKYVLEAPFDIKVAAGEEWSLVKNILTRSQKISYAPTAMVYHSHSIERLYLKAYIYAYGLCQTTDGPYYSNIGYSMAHFFFWLMKDFIFFIKKRYFSDLYKLTFHEILRHYYLWKGSVDFKEGKPTKFNSTMFKLFSSIIGIKGKQPQTPLH